MIETRKSNRRRVLKRATALFHNKNSIMECQVRDISDTGCRLRVNGSHQFPHAFTLTVELDGLEADCQIVWRKSSDLGVRFTGSPRKIAPKRLQVVQCVRPAAQPVMARLGS